MKKFIIEMPEKVYTIKYELGLKLNECDVIDFTANKDGLLTITYKCNESIYKEDVNWHLLFFNKDDGLKYLKELENRRCCTTNT